MDAIDRASEREAHDRELALAAQRQRAQAPRRTSGNGICMDCGHGIEPRRLRVLGPHILRCASCARIHEAKPLNGRPR